MKQVENITVGNSEVEKHNFHQQKSRISIYDVNVDKIVVCSRVPFRKMGFNGNKDRYDR